MKQAIQNTEVIDGEINIWTLINSLKNGWRWLMSGGMAGLVGAFGYIIFTPAQYEARMVVQPASISIDFSIDDVDGQTMHVEPLAQTLERLRLVTFYDDNIVQACQVNSPEELANRVTVAPVRTSSLLSIKYRAHSSRLANTCATKVLEKLIQSQAAISVPMIEEKEKQRAFTKQSIADLEGFLAQYEQRVYDQSSSDTALTLIVMKRDELKELRKLYRDQSIQLKEPFMQPMKLLEPIYLPKKPVSPKKLMSVVGGLVGGLSVGLLALFVNHSWRSYRSRAC